MEIAIGVLIVVTVLMGINTFYLWGQLSAANNAWEKKCEAYREMRNQRDLYRNEARIQKQMIEQYDKEIARIKAEIVELQNPSDTIQELAEKNVKRPRCLIRPKTTAQVMDEDS